MLRQLQRFLKDETGTAAVEYTLLVSCISVVIIPGVKNVGLKLVDIFTVLERAV
jgi:Flp pilus assembly pilin Flp